MPAKKSLWQRFINSPSTLMAIALCLHFLANEFARAASLSLLASKVSLYSFELHIHVFIF